MNAWLEMRRVVRGLVGAAAFMWASIACAQPMAVLDDGELSAVSAQGLLLLSNSSYGGLDFTRVGLSADVQLNANFSNIRLGEYSYAARNATGADIDIPVLRFGRSDGTDAQRVVTLNDPYLEFVFKGSGSSRELLGARFGFSGVSGDIGLQIAALSGSLRVNGVPGNVDVSADPLGGKRLAGSCASGSTPCLPLAGVGAVTAGDTNGASRDFWVAMLKAPVQFAATSGMATAPALAQPGMWMNWTDRLQAVQGSVPPNQPKVGP